MYVCMYVSMYVYLNHVRKYVVLYTDARKKSL